MSSPLRQAKQDEYSITLIDMLEAIAKESDWNYNRGSPEEISTEIQAQWKTYQLLFFENTDDELLDVECNLDLKIPTEKHIEIFRLCAHINREITLGHLDIDLEQSCVCYHYTGLLAGHEDTGADYIAELINYVIFDLDRFYPAFKIVIENDVSAMQALDIALIDPVGEA